MFWYTSVYQVHVYSKIILPQIYYSEDNKRNGMSSLDFGFIGCLTILQMTLFRTIFSKVTLGNSN